MNLKTIPESYKNGDPVMEGDIVAEGHIGELIWQDKGVIVRRPLGVVIIQPRKQLTIGNTVLDKSEFYNLREIRSGEAKFIEANQEEWFKEMMKNTDEDQRVQQFHLSTIDGGFYAWDDVEKVGSIYDFI